LRDNLIKRFIKLGFTAPDGTQAIANGGGPLIIAFENRLHVSISERVQKDFLI
jgi:hypothetical protein